MTSPATLPSTYGNNYRPYHTPPRPQQQQQQQQEQHYHHLQSSQQHFNITHQEIKMELVEQSLPDQHDHSPRNQNHYPHHYQNYLQQQQYHQYQPRPRQSQQHLHPYRNHRRAMDENDNENVVEDHDDQDLDEEGEQDEDQHRHPYSNGEHSAYNSAYNSETEDVNMDCVALKEDLDLDHGMSELRSSSSASSSSSSLTNAPAPSTKSSIATIHSHSHYPYLSQAQGYPHRPHHTLLSAPSSSSATSTTPSKAKQSNSSSAASGTLAIKPRPTLRPLLPSRPTSPQPMIPSRSNIDSDNSQLVSSGPSSSSMSSSSRLQSNNTVPVFGSTNTNTNNSSESTSSTSHNDSRTAKTRQSAYKINGLNILNRNSLDSRTALEMIRRRRENHNHGERRRRDTLNSTIMHIAEILPNCSSSAKLNKGAILRLALDHLRSLHDDNHSLRSENAALRFFYQGSPTKRPEPHTSGPLGPSPPLLSLPSAFSIPTPPNASVTASSSLSYSHPSSRGSSMSTPSSSQMSVMGIPPIIPGPGKGMIPALGVRPGSAANSPPGQHLPFPVVNANNSSHSVSGVKRSMSASGHLQPVLFRNQQSSSRVSPSPSAHPRTSPGSSSSGVVMSSPCSSPTLDPLSMSPSTHQPVSAPTNALHAMASALPSVPASHQNSAAVSAAAAAAAAAASRNSSGTPQPLPLVRHQKTHSGGSSGSSQSAAGSSPMTMHHHHHHHHHHHSPQSQSQQLQVHAHQKQQQQQQQQQSQLQLHPLGSGSYGSHPGVGARLPSLESLTDPSSPMTSPLQGPSSYSNRASPSVSLPGPMDSSLGQQQQQQHAQSHSPSGQGQSPSNNRVHPMESLNLPILPPLAPRP